MSEQIRLKPCPLCGSEHVKLWKDDTAGVCWIECEECNVSTRHYYSLKLLDLAVNCWNTRVNSDDLSQVEKGE